MGRHSARHNDETDIIAQVVLDEHIPTSRSHYTPMFKGLADTDEHTDLIEVPPQGAEEKPTPANTPALWIVSVVAVIMTIASLALAAYLEFRPAPKPPCPVRLVPSQIITPAPVTITEHP